MDFIPASYRTYLKQLRIIRAWTTAALGLGAAAMAAVFVLADINDEYAAEIAILEKQKAISSHQRGILESLQAEFDKLEDKHNVLLKLRGGAAANEMFVTIDRALEEKDIWFTSWEFNRAGSKTADNPDEVNTGYFIIVRSDTDNNKDAAWKIQTHMEIDGQALDHAALSGFVRKLLKQPEIHDVRVLKTRSGRSGSSDIIDFSIVVVVNSNVSNA